MEFLIEGGHMLDIVNLFNLNQRFKPEFGYYAAFWRIPAFRHDARPQMLIFSLGNSFGKGLMIEVVFITIVADAW